MRFCHAVFQSKHLVDPEVDVDIDNYIEWPLQVPQAALPLLLDASDVHRPLPYGCWLHSRYGVGQCRRDACNSWHLHSWRLHHPEARDQGVVDLGVLGIPLYICPECRQRKRVSCTTVARSGQYFHHGPNRTLKVWSPEIREVSHQ